MKKKLGINNISDNNSKTPFTEEAFNVNITVNNEISQKIARRVSPHITELGYTTLLSLFRLISNEVLKVNFVKNVSDEFGNIVKVLFQRFSLGDLDDQRSIENSLKNYIKKLKEYKFYLPNNLVVDTKKDELIPFESDLGYEGDLESTLQCIKEALKSLRDEKINFWSKLLGEYEKDKEGYDLEFQTKASRHKKDLDRVSKLTDEDIKSLL